MQTGHASRNFQSKVPASVSRYLRYAVDNPDTGMKVNYMFEIQLSDHDLPEELEFESLVFLQDVIDRYEDETGEKLEPYPFRFIVNNETHNSYPEALEIVKGLLVDMVSLYIKI